MRILIVEDEVRLASTLKDLLEMNSYTADVCHDGETGLDNALTGIYDVIVGMNEFTLAGTDLGPDTAREDEYVGVIAADGTLVKATLISSELNVVKAKFESALEAGEYTLIVATRSGFGGDVAVKSATRKVMVG